MFRIAKGYLHGIGLALLLVMVMTLIMPVAPARAAAVPTPTFKIVSVVPGVSVTIETKNFPANMDFTVRLGEYGTYAIGGYVVATTNSGTGGVFQSTYTIPDALKNQATLAIRMDGRLGYYAYNYFSNVVGGATPVPITTPVPGTTPTPRPPAYTGIPTFSIQAVVRDQTVTILTKNLPPNQTFTVRMGAYGTRAIGGIVIGTTESGAGGALTLTYTIPDSLKGRYQIAIRMDSPQGYYSYNWFYNNDTSE
ncbi:MAG TPA: hypothetical protein PKG95_04585 [Anaerolineaceae bacterium]|nr:hypothetical protein [Anaerolineaceae bacterium]